MTTSDDSQKGVYGKYIISKADGSEVDPEACYFVLRLDGDDDAACAAMRLYAERTPNEKLAEHINGCLDELEAPRCGCREAHCTHEAFFSDVWRHGGSL